ncbi:hypothetical protein Tco_0263169, partial [Tanacetum coccineum]
SNGGSSVSQLTNEKISNFLGRKVSAGFLQSTPITLTLEDVTNPLEEGEIPKRIEEVEWSGVSHQGRIF